MFRLFKHKEKTHSGLKKSRDTWFGHLAGLFQREHLDEEVWEEAEAILLGADVGVSTATTLLERARQRIQADGGAGHDALEVLKEEMRSILEAPLKAPTTSSPPGESVEPSRPQVILVLGVNGVGKTTSIGKLAALYRDDEQRVILGAADTFRAAAIEQLQVWGQRVDAEVIAHRQGADPGAVAYDAFQAAQARGADVLIIDTAGRLHTKSNLMEEMKKVKRVLTRLDPTAPHQTLLVLDATTGQNGLAQAQSFTEAMDCTGILLAKLDGTAKGGIVLAICDQLHLPVLFIGTGEGLNDLAPFDPEEFVEALFAPVPQEAQS